MMYAAVLGGIGALIISVLALDLWKARQRRLRRDRRSLTITFRTPRDRETTDTAQL